MKKLLAIALGIIFFVSCRDNNNDVVLSKMALPVTGDQAVPQKTVSGTGTIDVYYNQSLKMLYYTVKWNSLTGAPVSGFGIYGPAAPGFIGPLKQSFSGFTAAASGTYSGSVFIDGTVLKEEELLQGEYFVLIPTAANSAAAGGEIRGQIKF